MQDKNVTVTIGDKKYSVLKGTTLEKIKDEFYSESKAIVVNGRRVYEFGMNFVMTESSLMKGRCRSER